MDSRFNYESWYSENLKKYLKNFVGSRECDFISKELEIYNRNLESLPTKLPTINELTYLRENSEITINDINALTLKESENILIAIANCKSKETIYNIYQENKTFNIVSFIHKTVILGKSAELGKGIVISPNVIISCNASIDKGVFINCGSQIGHDVTIGEFSSIMADVNIGGGVIIGKNVTIGSGAVILPGVKIIDNVIIGAGSIVLRNVKKVGTYFGNPARKIL